MSDVEGAVPPPPRIPLWFLIVLPLLVLVFFTLGLHRANRTTLRGDEVVSLVEFAQARSVMDMIVHGVKPQVSPAPLLYILDRVVSDAKRPLGYLGLTPPGYFRLPSLLLSAGLGFAAALVLALQIRRAENGGMPIQYFLLLAGLATFLFHPKEFAFAGTERPHAFWNALWFLLISWLLVHPPTPRVPLAILCLMGATATSSCFQIFSVGVALGVVRRVERQPLKQTLKEGALLLAAPAVIGAYYALRSEFAAYDEREINELAPHFFKFWLWTNLHVWIACAGMIALVIARPKLRIFALPPAALSVLILMVPLIFALSRLRGFPLVSRQYLWTTTAVPLAMFFAAASWPELRPTPLLRGLAIAACLGIVAGNVGVTLAQPPRNDSFELALFQKDSPLMTLLRTERPAGLVVPDSFGPVESNNLVLFGQWAMIRNQDKPVGSKYVVIRVAAGRLIADSIVDEPARDCHVIVAFR